MAVSERLQTGAYKAAMPEDRTVSCNTWLLSDLLLQQWKLLTTEELSETQFQIGRLGCLIEEKYGIPHLLAEHYLCHLERILPPSP